MKTKTIDHNDNEGENNVAVIVIVFIYLQWCNSIRTHSPEFPKSNAAGKYKPLSWNGPSLVIYHSNLG